MYRLHYGVLSALILLVSLIATSQVHADERFRSLTDGLPDRLEFQAQACPSEMSTREADRGYHLFCGTTDRKAGRFKKRWRKLLDSTRALSPDPGTGWRKSPDGALSFEFWYWEYPASVRFDKTTGQVVFAFYTREPSCLTDSPLQPVEGGKIYKRGHPGLTPPVRTAYGYPDIGLDNLGLFDLSLVLRMIIDRTGTPTQICFLRASPDNPARKENWLEAVKQWRYKPAMLNGQPVDFYLTVFVRQF